jgi:prefoldin alpha subunit
MLVPVTDSMFVPGKLASSTEVLIDIGTGYFLKKSIPGAVKILDKKVGVCERACMVYDGL